MGNHPIWNQPVPEPVRIVVGGLPPDYKATRPPSSNSSFRPVQLSPERRCELMMRIHNKEVREHRQAVQSLERRLEETNAEKADERKKRKRCEAENERLMKELVPLRRAQRMAASSSNSGGRGGTQGKGPAAKKMVHELLRSVHPDKSANARPINRHEVTAALTNILAELNGATKATS